MRIDVSGHTFVFPHRCACCDGVPDSHLSVSASKSSGKRVVHTRTNVWDMPYCSVCIKHVAALRGARVLMGFLVVFSIAVAVIIGSQSDEGIGILAGIALLIGTAFIYKGLAAHARALCNAGCTCAGSAAAYAGWHGTVHQFDFASIQFAREFMAANANKLINLSPQARQLLPEDTSRAAPKAPRRYST